MNSQEQFVGAVQDAVGAVLKGLHRPSPKEAVAVLHVRAAEFAYGTLTDDICLLAARIT